MIALYLICLVVGFLVSALVVLAEANRPIPWKDIPPTLIVSALAFLFGLVMTGWTFVSFVSGFFS